MDRPRIRAALRRLDALVQANPQLRTAAARRRLAAVLAGLGANADTSNPPDAPTGRTGQGTDNP